jgi:hypothetical protein
MRLEPICKISSPHPLIYLRENEAITLSNAKRLLAVAPISRIPNRVHQKPLMIIWAEYKNQIEVCFDLADAAKQMGVSLDFVMRISTGFTPTPKQIFIVPLPTDGLLGHKRESLKLALSFDQMKIPASKKLMYFGPDRIPK